MPTYEYECKSCGHAFEQFQSMMAKPLKRCPKCGKAVQRLIGSGAGFIFKGSGFYETDYKKKSASPSSGETKPAPEKTPAVKEKPESKKSTAKKKESD